MGKSVVALTFPVIMAKWLKKAKLRDGTNEVGLYGDTFYYRGFSIGVMEFANAKHIIKLEWPATSKNPWAAPEKLDLADPKFFIKLRKAFRTAMTTIDGHLCTIIIGQNSRTKQ
jgi:hypothetical protein